MFKIKESISTYNYSLVPGYSRILINKPTKVMRGSIIIIKSQQPVYLAIDSRNDSIYADFEISGNSLIELNAYYNYRIFFNCLIDQTFYTNFLSVFHSYDYYGQYEMSVSMNNSKVSSTVYVDSSN